MTMFPCTNNRSSVESALNRVSWLPSRGRFGTFSLGHNFCPSHVCAKTRVSIKETAIGGALRPLPAPDPSQARRWKSAITLSLPANSSLTATTYEDISGEGSLVWQSRSRVLRRRSYASTKSRQQTKATSDTLDFNSLRNQGLIASRNHNFSLKNCIQGLTLQLPTKPFARLFKKRKSNTTVQRERRMKLDLRKTAKRSTMSFSFDDTDFGHAKISLTPKEKTSASLRIMHRFRKKRDNASVSNPKKFKRTTSSSETKLLSMQSDIEYDWKKDSYVTLHRAENSLQTIQLRVATNPIRATPLVKIPLGANKSSSPYFSWTREPQAGIGFFELGWNGMQISTDWAHPSLSIRRQTADGGYSAVSLNNRRVMQLDQNLVSKPSSGGVVLSLNSCMSNKDLIGVSVTATAPWGSISGHARSSRDCGFSIVSKHARKKGSVRLKLSMENLRTSSFRLGIFY